MVISPGIRDCEYTYENGKKLFTLVAQEIIWELVDGIKIRAWGYNGSTPGPTIHVFPGEEVVIRVVNELPVETSVHWHGLVVPNDMDGVPPIEPTPFIKPGYYFDYEFTVNNPPGTYMYHSHVDVMKQNNAGLLGGLIVEDPKNLGRKCYRDYLYLLQQWAIKELEPGKLTPGVYSLNFMEPRFNFFTMNGTCYPKTLPMVADYGDTVRVRYGTIQMDHHPMHLHGHQFCVVASDGYPIGKSARLYKNTILVGSGETWDVEFIADNPGIWPFHCHMPHDATNNGAPGIGGMFTTVNYCTGVPEEFDYCDPDWPRRT